MPAPEVVRTSGWPHLVALARERGVLAALGYALYRLADPIVALRVYRVRVLEMEHMTRTEEAPEFECGFLTPEQVARFAEDPTNDLGAGFVARAASGRDLCFAALRDGDLASYTWYALGDVDPADSSGVPLRLPADAAYAYKAYTRPELRGRHLHGRLKRPVVQALLSRGISRRVTLIEWSNWPSLRTSERSGYRDVGWLVTLGRGPRPLALVSPGPGRQGIRLGRRAAAARGTLPRQDPVAPSREPPGAPMSNETPLAGRTAIVTGASSGIGRAIAHSLGAAGAHVFLSGRTRASMEQTAKEIEEAGGRASVSVADLRDVAQVQELVAGAVRETGRLDVMVNNAGLSHPAGIADGNPEEWREMLELNVLSLLVGCQAAVRAMRQCGAEGHIVNISSVAAQRRESGVYGATKHAVNCISATLRLELEEDSIRVVNVMPGAIATNFARNFDPEFVKGFARMSGIDHDVKKGERLPDEVLEELQPKLKQLLSAPEDVARAVLFAVTQPIETNIADIVIRPAKQLNL